jgi:hypothetical protein
LKQSYNIRKYNGSYDTLSVSRVAYKNKRYKVNGRSGTITLEDAGFVLFNIDDNVHCLPEDFVLSQVMTSFDKKDKADNWRNHPTFRRNHPTERLFIRPFV